MSSIAKGITEEGWRVDAATGNRRPSDLNVGDLILLLGGTYGDRLRWNLLTNKAELDNQVIEEDHKDYFYLSLASIGWKCGKDPSRDSIDYVARNNRYHPVTDYLNFTDLIFIWATLIVSFGLILGILGNYYVLRKDINRLNLSELLAQKFLLISTPLIFAAILFFVFI